MVLLTMTDAIVAALERHPELKGDTGVQKSPQDPSLLQPQVKNPISHGQILEIHAHIRNLSEDTIDQVRLHDLLRGAEVYTPPAKPRPEPTSEYKELMARLRRNEEAKAYGQMLNSSTDYKNPFQKLAAPDSAATWDLHAPGAEPDEMKMSDVNRQMALIANVLISIIACGIAVWLILRQWSAPVRLAASMSCGALVGVAEIVIYAAYIRKLGEAKSLEKSKQETRSIANTWVIEAAKPPIAAQTDHRDSAAKGTEAGNLRQRKHVPG